LKNAAFFLKPYHQKTIRNYLLDFLVLRFALAFFVLALLHLLAHLRLAISISYKKLKIKKLTQR